MMVRGEKMPTRRIGKHLSELEESLVDEGFDEEEVCKLIDALEQDIDEMSENGGHSDEEPSA